MEYSLFLLTLRITFVQRINNNNILLAVFDAFSTQVSFQKKWYIKFLFDFDSHTLLLNV